jgi:hypothetical protein
MGVLRQGLGINAAENNRHVLVDGIPITPNAVRPQFQSHTDVETNNQTQLSAVTSLKNDRAVSENTDHMARLAEYSREESISMGNIARATKLDSEAMKTIAIMTMLYLPATFVAVSAELPT